MWITMVGGSIIIWHRHQKHFHSGKICVKNNRITAAHVSVLSECHDYADWIIMCRVNTMQSRWKVRVLKLKAVKAKIWRGAGSQYFTNNLWPGCLVWSWGELASTGCQWPDLILIGADQQICGFCRWSHVGSRARGNENEFIRSDVARASLWALRRVP